MAEPDANIVVGADVSAVIDSFAKITDAAGKLTSDIDALNKLEIRFGIDPGSLAGDIEDVVANRLKKAGEKALDNQVKVDEQARQAAIKQEEYLKNLKSKSAVVNQQIAEKQSAEERKVIAENNAIMNKYDNKRIADAQKRADDLADIDRRRVEREVENAQFLNKARNDLEAKTRQDELASMRSNMQATAQADKELINTLPRLRYALYDVASGFQATSQTLLGFGKNVLDATVQYETAFTNVERVTDLNAQQTAVLRNELKALALQIPLTFQDITGIATLGAQLGVSEQSLASFSGTVSKFSAVANVSNESAAQSFGALSELLNFAEADFEKFGSSVAYAGSQTVATESEILSVATQIGGVAGAAGFSAEKVVGLATALASLRIPAEQSRGAVTRVFQEINRSVAENGPQLQTFASLMGMSAEEAANLARTDMSGFFDTFVQGLQGMNPQQITQALDALNLSDQRVTNTLTRLASNFNVVRDSQAYASKGFEDGTFLAESFADKADDLASKIQFLQNAISNLADTAGQTLSPVLGGLIDTLKNIVAGVEQFASTNWGGFFIGTAVAVTVLVGAIAALIAVTLTAVGGSLALATAFAAIKGAATGSFIASLTSVITTMTGVTISAGTATAALAALRIALILSGVGIAVVALGALAAGLAGAAATSGKAADGTSNWSKTVSKAQANADKLKNSTAGVNEEFNNMGSGSGGGSAGKAAEKIRTLTDYANDLSSVFSRAFEIRFSSGSALDNITKSFSSMAKATADAQDQIKGLNADIQSLQADQALQQYFLTVAEAYGDTLKAQEIRANLAKIDADLTSKTKTLQTAQDKTNKTLVGNSDAAIDNRSQITGLVKDYQSYIKSLADSGMKQDELAAKTAAAKAEFIANAQALGFSATEIDKYAAAFDDVGFAISNVARNVTIDVDTNPAKTALDELLAKTQETAAGMTGAMNGVDFSPAVEESNSVTTAVQNGNRETGTHRDTLNETVLKYRELGGEARVTQDQIQQDWRNTYSVTSGTTTSMTGDFARYSDSTKAKFKEVADVGRTEIGSVGSNWSNMAYNMPGLVSAQQDNVRYSFQKVGAKASEGFQSGGSSVFGSNWWTSALRSIFRFKDGGLVGEYASGGYISGPGSATSDSIPAMLSNGEYVMRASAVNRYGVGFFDQLNQMKAPAYYSGGAVGAAAGGGMVSLSPEDRALLRNVGGSGNIVLYADSKELARSVNDGNRQIVASGGRP